MIIGFAWGTIGAVSQHLTKTSTRGSVVLHLNGGVNNGKSDADCVGTRISRFGEASGARRRFFSVLTFLDYVGTRCAMWLDRSIAPVLEMQRQVNIGLSSVGAVTGPCSLSRVLRTRRHPGLESAGGGDVCTVFLRADGMHEDLSLHERAASLTPTESNACPVACAMRPETTRFAPSMANQPSSARKRPTRTAKKAHEILRTSPSPRYGTRSHCESR